jgi:hypothetical protein
MASRLSSTEVCVGRVVASNDDRSSELAALGREARFRASKLVPVSESVPTRISPALSAKIR